MARKLSLAQKRTTTAGQPERELSALVMKKLGIEIPPVKARDFVRNNFHILSILAHEIHAAEVRETGAIELGG